MNSAVLPAAHCFTVPLSQDFINQLAAWMLAEYGRGEALSRALVLLPHRRACRSLREAFLEQTGGKPLLLARIQPIGEAGEEALLWAEGATEIPPAMPPLKRQLLLARLVMRRQACGAAEAMKLAAQLAQFIDDAAREGVTFSGLQRLAPEELATHWQQTLDFLTIVSAAWPKVLAEENALDPVERRNRMLSAVAAAWKKKPPDYPVIAAGSTGSQPATAALMSVIARLPQGRVILPGLDTGMAEEEWKQITETHPQFALKVLLERMGCEREQVITLSLEGRGQGEGCSPLIPALEEESNPHPSLLPSREKETIQCLRAIFAPPLATARWSDAELPLEELAHFRVMEADTLQQEARLVALLLREVLETPGKTAALVTPDRELARMVAAQMRRFGIVIDDSAGRALSDTPPGVYLRLAAEMAESGAAPANLLALLRHPLAAAGMEPAQCRALSRQLEIAQLRGVRHRPGLESLLHAPRMDEEMRALLVRFTKEAKPLMTLMGRKAAPLSELLSAHIAFAEYLASTPAESGAARLWAGEAGEKISAYLAELAQHAGLLTAVDPRGYAALFASLLSSQSYWPRYGQHPRLHILSPMEARLSHYDRMILSGLNEGTWPALPAADPWMSRPMRQAFGLPAATRSIGQSAHDVWLLSGAPEVIWTRARKVSGTPAIASRWLTRLATLIGGKDRDAYARMSSHADYDRAAARLDAPLEMPPLLPPAPKPPLAARPRRLRVTAIDAWLRDPYSIYARYVLGLKALDALDREPNAADFGTLVHRALERFANEYPSRLPENVYEKLLACGQKAFALFLDRPAVECLWWPRFTAMSAWLAAREQERRPRLETVLAELQGEWEFAVDDKKFTLTTRIDRMEIGQGGVTLVDHKTGSLPKASDIESGMAMQLPLEALIAKYGQVTPAPALAGDVRMEYWKLAGAEDKCEVEAVEADLEQTRERLMALIRRFDDAATAYAAQSDPRLIARHSDYAHLTRRQEWGEL